MATSYYIDGDALETMLNAIPTYTTGNYILKSGDTYSNGNLIIPELYTYTDSVYVGNQGDSLKAIYFNNAGGTYTHNFRIMANAATSAQGFCLHDQQNNIMPLQYYVSNHRVYTQCPWQQSGMTVGLEATTTVSSTAGSSVTLPMTVVKNSYGSILSQSGNGIKVSVDCMLEISARIYLSVTAKGNAYTISLRNSSSGTAANTSQAGQSTKYMPLMISPILVEAPAGSIITCVLVNETSTTGTAHTLSRMSARVVGIM